MTPQVSLKDQVAIITGAGSGIGAEVARQLAACGTHLVLSGRTASKLETLEAQLKQAFPQVKILSRPTDVSRADEARALVAFTLKELGRLDILVNNAGVAGKIALLQEIPEEEIHRTLDINLKGAIFMMQEALKQAMVPAQRGAIVNINSIAGKSPFPYWSIYDASKFGLRAVTDAVAQEQRTNNIKVVGIYPGAVDTPIWNTIELDHEPRHEGMLDAGTVAESVVHVLRQPGKVFISDVTLEPLQPVL